MSQYDTNNKLSAKSGASLSARLGAFLSTNLGAYSINITNDLKTGIYCRTDINETIATPATYDPKIYVEMVEKL